MIIEVAIITGCVIVLVVFSIIGYKRYRPNLPRNTTELEYI